MGEVIEFPSEDARYKSQVEVKLKEALSDVPEPKYSQILQDILSKLHVHRENLKYSFKLNLPPDTDPTEIEKIKENLARVASYAYELALDNLVLTVKLMLRDN